MANNVKLDRRENENNLSILRRFTRRMNSSGVINRVKSIRYSSRKQSPYKQKKQALAVMKRQAEYEKLAKLGKVAETSFRRQ